MLWLLAPINIWLTAAAASARQQQPPPLPPWGSPQEYKPQQQQQDLTLVRKLKESQAPGGGCPCSSPSLCRPVARPTSHQQPEVVSYYLFDGSDDDLAHAFDNVAWVTVTTIMAIHAPPVSLVCTAHEHNRRVVLSVTPERSKWFAFDLDQQLKNASARRDWVVSLAAYCENHFLDGVNLDIEDNLPSNRAALTVLTQEVAAALRHSNPEAQISFATRVDTEKFAGSVANFDYPGLAQYCDFFFVMGYDMNKGTTLAESDGPIKPLEQSISRYISLGVNASKLVLGVALFATDYTCTTTAIKRDQSGQATPANPCVKITPWAKSIQRRPIAGSLGKQL